MTTLQAIIRNAAAQLEFITPTPMLEAEILLAHTLNQARSYLRAWPEKTVSPAELQQFTLYLNRRCQHEPIAYITGHREFWSHDLLVTPDTLIPRPETEQLVEAVLTLTKPQLKIADLGTGSGAIAIALASERPDWQILATDVSEKSLSVASQNAQRLRLNNISFYLGSWCTALPCYDLDVIVSNPPYIAETEWEAYAQGLGFEPRTALVAGPDGLDAIRLIIQTAKYYLKPGGCFFLEHGFSQGKAVREQLVAAGYQQVRTLFDLEGHERIAVSQVSG
jgi:release factor glutamine methyltransferase